MPWLKRLAAAQLALIILLVVMGCGTGTATPLSPRDIAANAVSAYGNVKTARMDLTMSMDMATTGGKQPVNVSVDVTGTGAFNIPANQAHLTLNMSTQLPSPVGTQKMSTDMYMMDGWMYMKMDVPGVGGWFKMKTGADVWSGQNQLAQQIELLKSALEVTSLPDETVNGISCYVLSVKPDMAALAGLVNSQLQQQASGAQLPESLDYSKVIKDLTVKEWLSKKDYLPVKSSVKMAFEMNAADVGATANDFDKMTMNMMALVTYSGYNEPLSITLPADATSAREGPTP